MTPKKKQNFILFFLFSGEGGEVISFSFNNHPIPLHKTQAASAFIYAHEVKL